MDEIIKEYPKTKEQKKLNKVSDANNEALKLTKKASNKSFESSVESIGAELRKQNNGFQTSIISIRPTPTFSATKKEKFKQTITTIDGATDYLNAPINFNPKKKGTVVYMNSKIDAIFENKNQNIQRVYGSKAQTPGLREKFFNSKVRTGGLGTQKRTSLFQPSKY
jgi:hypothetical protein